MRFLIEGATKSKNRVQSHSHTQRFVTFLRGCGGFSVLVRSTMPWSPAQAAGIQAKAADRSRR